MLQKTRPHANELSKLEHNWLPFEVGDALKVDYLLYIIVYICNGILSNPSHCVCLSTAGLPICKNTRCNIYLLFYVEKIVMKFESNSRNKGKLGKEILYSQLTPLTTDRATCLAPSLYTCLVEQSEENTLSREKRQIRKS